MKRRDVLRLGASGVTAALGALPLAASGVHALETPLRARSGLDQVPVTPEAPPPDVQTIVNPRRLPNESWAEPWIWRPEEWQEQALDLNVVGGQNVGTQLPPGHRFLGYCPVVTLSQTISLLRPRETPGPTSPESLVARLAERGFHIIGHTHALSSPRCRSSSL